MSVNDDKVRLFASNENWIEGIAVSQLRGTANLPGVERAVGLPDLHPGKNGPVGAAFVTREILYPHLVGNDVGCGMGLWRTGLSARKVKLERWAERLTGLDEPWEGHHAEWLERFGVSPGRHDLALGTIGGGNHFAELQQVDRVEDAVAFAALGLDADRLVVLVHSGSRGLGKEVLETYQQSHGHAGCAADGETGRLYLESHGYATRWAEASRALIAARFAAGLRTEAAKVLDAPHNYIARETLSGREAWIHRKGATPAGQGALVIPGSRGTRSYLVVPVGDQEANAHSLAHGAGRKWNRSDCRARLRDRYDEAALTRTDLGGRVICEDRDLLYEEAPQAYKNIEVVIEDLRRAGLIRVVAAFRPLLTYKLRRSQA